MPDHHDGAGAWLKSTPQTHAHREQQNAKRSREVMGGGGGGPGVSVDDRVDRCPHGQVSSCSKRVVPGVRGYGTTCEEGAESTVTVVLFLPSGHLPGDEASDPPAHGVSLLMALHSVQPVHVASGVTPVSVMV
jgi:hypothetical protein